MLWRRAMFRRSFAALWMTGLEVFLFEQATIQTLAPNISLSIQSPHHAAHHGDCERNPGFFF